MKKLEEKEVLYRTEISKLNKNSKEALAQLWFNLKIKRID